MAGTYTISAEEFSNTILRAHYLNPCGMNDGGFNYVPINGETFQRLKKSSAFTESELRGLESRVN